MNPNKTLKYMDASFCEGVKLVNSTKSLGCAPTRDTPRQTPLVFDTLNIKAPCVRKPLTREQLRVLFDLIVEEVQNQDSDDEYLH